MRYRPFIIVLAAGLLLTSCSDNTTGGNPSTAAPQPSSTDNIVPSASAGALPHSGAPKVASPLPVSVLSGDPCVDALTPAQVKDALGIEDVGEPGSIATGKLCNWGNPRSGALVSITYGTETKQGLSGLYQNVKPQATVWKELPPIQGFPAVAQVSAASGQIDRYCQVSVGLADDLSFDAGIFLSDSKVGKMDPCEPAAQVANNAITTLRQKAGA